MLQEVCEKIPTDVNLYVMYDIPCSLVRYLQVDLCLSSMYIPHAVYGRYICTFLFLHLKSNVEIELLQRVHFAIPSSHAYCHIPSCQVCSLTAVHVAYATIVVRY